MYPSYTHHTFACLTIFLIHPIVFYPSSHPVFLPFYVFKFSSHPRPQDRAGGAGGGEELRGVPARPRGSRIHPGHDRGPGARGLPSVVGEARVLSGAGH